MIKQKLLKAPKGQKNVILFGFFVIIWYWVSIAAENESWDLGRYYGIIDGLPLNYGFFDVFNYFHGTYVDFIYFMILYSAKVVGISYNIVTAIIVTTYYYLVLAIIDNNYHKNVEWYILFTILFSSPIIWIIEISRNLTAYMFFYFAFYYYYKKKWMLVATFIAIAVFTHFSVLMYVAVFALAWILRNVKLKTWILFVLISTTLAGSFLIPDSVTRILEMSLGGTDMYYGRYTEIETMNILDVGNMSYGSISITFWAFAYSIIILLLSKKKNIEFWILFILTVMLAFFINSSQMFLNRCLMLMPLFWALNIVPAYLVKEKSTSYFIKGLSLAGFIPMFLFFWKSRNFFLPFIFG